MTHQQFTEKYNSNSSLIYYYKRELKIQNVQQIDNIIQERQNLRLKVQDIMIDKTGNDIKEFFNTTTRAYQFVNKLFQILDGEILLQSRTVDKYIKIINKYEEKMIKIHITDNIILNQNLADEILKIAHKKKIIKSDDVLNGCDYFTYYPNTKIVSFHIKDPLFWEDLSLKDFLICYEEIVSKKVA